MATEHTRLCHSIPFFTLTTQNRISIDLCPDAEYSHKRTHAVHGCEIRSVRKLCLFSVICSDTKLKMNVIVQPFYARLKAGLQPAVQCCRVANPPRAMLENFWSSTYIDIHRSQHHGRLHLDLIGAAEFVEIIGISGSRIGLQRDGCNSISL